MSDTLADVRALLERAALNAPYGHATLRGDEIALRSLAAALGEGAVERVAVSLYVRASAPNATPEDWERESLTYRTYWSTMGRCAITALLTPTTTETTSGFDGEDGG